MKSRSVGFLVALRRVGSGARAGLSALLLTLAASAGAAAPPSAGRDLSVPSSALFAHRHVFPELRVDQPGRQATWTAVDGGLRSPVEAPLGGGSRAAAFVELPASADVRLEVEVRGADGALRRVPMERTFIQSDASVFIAELGETVSEASLWIGVADNLWVDAVRWELLSPRFPDAGPRSRAFVRGPRPPPPPLDAGLTDIGVVTRDAWGARSTTCTGLEDDWYRMAIHHTAGSQTSGGTVAGAVAAVQAYAMDSGTYCDIPYEFMVGYDGTLYEGRELSYTSGATGGGQNDGNAAMCFLGCYHPSDCPGGSHTATDAMMDAGRLLVQTMSVLHDIPIDTDAIKGHRDWPGNSTACPGDYVVARFSELLIPPDLYAGLLAGAAFATDGSAPVVIELGQSVELYVDLENTGNTSWRPDHTFLATLPRDVEGPLSHPSWVSPTRLAGPSAEVPPGAVGRFVFTIEGARLGRAEQQLGLVEEWVTWFADAPRGGGPAEGTIALTVEVVEPAGAGPDTALPEDSGADGGLAEQPEDDGAPGADAAADDEGGGLAPGELISTDKLGGCAQADRWLGRGLWLIAAAVVLGRRAALTRRLG
jgi:N-acetylmuramoyl-L-alanine amidase